MSFRKDLEKSILNGEGDRNDLVIQSFKMIVSKAMEKNVDNNNDQLEAGFIESLRGYTINEFRGASLGEYQLSETAYSKLCDDTLRQIFALAAANHEGEDTMSFDKQSNLTIDKAGYHNEVVKTPGGLYVNKSAT